MGLDRDDRDWLDAKFETIHGRITEAKDELTESITTVKTDLAVHKATPCRDVLSHEEKKHNPAKTLGVLGSLAGLGAAAWEGFKFLISKATNH